MSNQANSLKKGLTVKDLVTTGIFSAIFFVFTLIGGLPFAPNPVLTFYMPMGAALLCGPIYLLMVAKVQKRWSVTILGIIMGIIWFATGMHWAFSLGYIGMGIIADLVAGAGHYRNKAISTFCTGPGRRLDSGIYAAGTHRVVPVASCLLHHPALDEAVEAVRQGRPGLEILPTLLSNRR